MCKLTKDALYTHTYIQATLKFFYMRSVAISEEHNSTFSPIWQHSTKILVTFHHPENCILKWWVFSLIYLFILLMNIMRLKQKPYKTLYRAEHFCSFSIITKISKSILTKCLSGVARKYARHFYYITHFTSAFYKRSILQVHFKMCQMS